MKLSALSVLSVLLGIGVAIPSVFALMKPAAFSAAVRKFPRSMGWGYALIALGTGWFLYYLSIESVSDFAAFKPYMYFGFSLLGVLACIFLTDFLAVRGLAIVFLLLAKLMVDTAHWANTPWRIVIVLWAYALILLGMWFTISPYRCRDLLQWATASEQRIRAHSVFRLAFCLVVILLGLTVY